MLIAAKRITFRPWTYEDFNYAMELWGDPEVTKFIDARTNLSKVDVEEKLEQQIYLQETYGISYWLLESSKDATFLGCCGLRPYPEANVLEIGFHIVKSQWRKGYASEAARAVIGSVEDHKMATKLFAGHNPKNLGSKLLLEKLGFQHERDEYYPPTGLLHPSYYLDLKAKE